MYDMVCTFASGNLGHVLNVNFYCHLIYLILTPLLYQNAISKIPKGRYVGALFYVAWLNIQIMIQFQPSRKRQ